ncbi:hypothetical protein [Serratia rubidaea]|uniref:hypothetical protein n=1 Tax=Serratia rubidaea TaxID=61652 RepID=UPI002432CA0E|nr:hypothetical protein [Serratia rubidaea]MCR0998647.1 hypothetical protein [Serratia rubidaea]
MTTVFPFRFKILNAADLVVLFRDESDVRRDLVLNTDYTISGVGSKNGGSITLTNPAPDGWTLYMERYVDIVQDTDIRNQGNFYPEVHEDAFDYLTMIDQQQQLELNRAVKVPPGSETNPGDLIEEIKLDAERAESAAERAEDVAEKLGDLDSAVESARADAGRAEAARGGAEAARDKAEQYATEAALNFPTFNSTAEGIAGTADGEYFRVPQQIGDLRSFIFYQHVGADAVEKTDYPSASSVRTALHAPNLIENSVAGDGAPLPTLITGITWNDNPSAALAAYGAKRTVLAPHINNGEGSENYLFYQDLSFVEPGNNVAVSFIYIGSRFYPFARFRFADGSQAGGMQVEDLGNGVYRGMSTATLPHGQKFIDVVWGYQQRDANTPDAEIALPMMAVSARPIAGIGGDMAAADYRLATVDVNKELPHAVRVEPSARKTLKNSNLLYQGTLTDFEHAYSETESFILFDNIKSTINSRQSGRWSINVDGVEQRRFYFPCLGSYYSDQKLSSPFAMFTMDNVTPLSITTANDDIVQLLFAIDKSVLTSKPGLATTELVVDITGSLAASTFSAGPSVTENSICATPTANNLRITVMTAELVRLGYNTKSLLDITRYIRKVARESRFLIYTGEWREYVGLDSVFSFTAPAGVITLTRGNYYATGFVSVHNRKSVVPADVGSYVYRSADIKNNTPYTFTDYPSELRVKFDPGMVDANSRLVLVDENENEIECQFADEFHPNLRHQSNLGFNSDNSLGSGSVIFYDTFTPGQQKFYELKAYAKPSKSISGAQVITNSDSSVSVKFGGYEYKFSENSLNLQYVVTPAGTTRQIRMVHYACGKSGSAIVDAEMMVSPAMRIIANGPVFVELETVLYNGTVGGVKPESIRTRTRTRIYRNGRMLIKTMHTAVNEIAVGILAGVYSRMALPDIAMNVTERNLFTPTLPDEATGKLWSISLVRANADQHRDGTRYGPTRPNYYGNGIPTGTTATRVYGGWKYQSTSDYSFLNWPVKKGWTWSNEFWLDFENEQGTEIDIIKSVYTRPLGRLGNPVYPQATRRALIRSFEDYCAGSAEWWHSDAATPQGGGPDKNNAYYCHTWDVYQYIENGKGNLDDIYAAFRDYCIAAWGGFSQIGYHYSTGKVGLHLASRLILPVYQWMYAAAVRDGNTTVQAGLRESVASFASALITYFDAHGAVALVATDGGRGNSNSNATAMRVLALAIHMNSGVADARRVFDALNALLNGDTYRHTDIITEGEGQNITAHSWLHYQTYATNNYLLACDLIGVEPSFDLVDYTLQAQSGLGGFREIEYSVSESRRGQINTVTFLSYPLLRCNRASAAVAMAEAWREMELQHNANPGMTRRIYGYEWISNNTKRYEVSFNIAVLCDTILSFK